MSLSILSNHLALFVYNLADISNQISSIKFYYCYNKYADYFFRTVCTIMPYIVLRSLLESFLAGSKSDFLLHLKLLFKITIYNLRIIQTREQRLHEANYCAENHLPIILIVPPRQQTGLHLLQHDTQFRALHD